MDSPAGSSPLFTTTHVVADLKRLALRGGAAKAVSQGVKFLLRVGGLVILARLVSPAEYGVYAMAATLTSLLLLFGDMGLATATVQRREITQRQISTLFWINAGIGLAFCAATAAMGPVLAWFYGEPRLKALSWLMACGFLLGGLAVQQQALLQRQMRFATLEAISLSSQVAGFLAMVWVAYRGGGAWALAVNLVAIRACSAVLVWGVSSWRPSAPHFEPGSRDFLVFGGHLSGYRLVDYLHRNLDNILIGRYWGPVALGLYGKAYGLLKIPLHQLEDPASAVAIPALSRLQDDPRRFRSYFLRATKTLVFVSMPLVVFTYIDARPIILMLLGPRWADVVPIFKALAPAAFFGTTNMLARWALVSLGRPERLFKVSTALLAVMIVAFVGGLPWGPLGVAAAYSAAYCLAAPLVAVYALRGSPVGAGDVIGAIWRPIVVSLASGLAALRLQSLMPGPHPAALEFAGDLAVFAVIYAFFWLLIPGGRDFVAGLARPMLEWLRARRAR